MKKTLEERIKAMLVKLGKRNAFLRILVLPLMVTAVCVFHMLNSLKHNTKRLALASMTFFLFAAYTSFSFPIFAGDEEESVSGNGYVLAEDPEAIELAREIKLDPEAMEILDDDDVLEGYVDAELHGLEDVDKYDLDEILESTENHGSRNVEVKQKAAPEPGTVFSKDDWRLVLINKQHPIPEDYTFTLGTIKNNMQCDERIIDDLLAMLQGAKADGVNLVICSPYRDMERQEMLFGRKITRYMNKGMSYMDAYKLASQAVTVPGASEHQIGLALDIVSDQYSGLDEGFGDTQAGRWLAENSAEYGFILRYPKGKEYITGIEYEPWHFRYVGEEAAAVIMDAGITLEEFWEDL